jgi:bifunctional non-homologous end joining protein LigD
MRPVLASQARVTPGGPQWAHEITWDRIRVPADVADGRLTTSWRHENDATTSLLELTGLAGPGVPTNVLIDGEIVTLDTGLAWFATRSVPIHVCNVTKARHLALTAPVTLLLVFDLLRLGGAELTALALARQRAPLEEASRRSADEQVPPCDGDGNAPHVATREAEIVVEVPSLGLSAQGRLHQPGHRGRRPDPTDDDLAHGG